MFGFGGGYAMLSLIQHEVVDHYQWLTLQQFTDVVAISQMTPGPIGINSATYVGYSVTQSVWGAIAATIAVRPVRPPSATPEALSTKISTSKLPCPDCCQCPFH